MRRNKRASLVGVLAAIAAISLALIANPTRTSADAGDPVSGTIQSTQVTNGDGTVTVYVRGQWVWTAHNSDCNTDRAGAGVAIAWNDPSEPGYSLTGKSTSGQTITLGVGVQTLRTGDTHNTVDEMVHPADVGNMASSLPGYNGQLFKDPSPPTPNSYQTWNGGCGSEPLPNGHPGGSWGYAVNGGKGYAHTYATASDVGNICVNLTTSMAAAPAPSSRTSAAPMRLRPTRTATIRSRATPST
jgi:hypothetical protein